MKRALKYISVFFIICLFIMGFSRILSSNISTYYMPDVMSDLCKVFNADNEINIDGKLMSIYLMASKEPFQLEGKSYDNFKGNEQYNLLKNNFYNIKRDPAIGTLKIEKNNSSEDITKIQSIETMDRVLKYKNILLNLTALIIGIMLYTKYEKRDIIEV